MRNLVMVWLSVAVLYAEEKPGGNEIINPEISAPKPAVGAAEPSVEGNSGTSDLPKEKNKYNRRVLLTIFVNEQHDKDRDYLGESIPEAFSAPLVKTGNFIVLNRKSVDRYLRTMGITINDVYKEENAVRLGKAAGADVVVVGKFITGGEFVTIEAKAIDVQAGLLSVQDSEQIKTNTTMFNSINHLAERMSGPMAEKMKPLETPPPPAEVVLTEEEVVAEVKKIEEKRAGEKGEPPPRDTQKLSFTIRAGGTVSLSLGYTASVYPLGFGGTVGGEVLGLSSLFFNREWLKDFELGLFCGYLVYPPKHTSYQTLSQIPVHATLGYQFRLPWYNGLTATPLVSAGMDFGKFANVNGSASYRIFAWSAGGRAEYAVSERWSIALTSLVLFEYDQGLNYQWVNFLSMGVRW